jgi:C terminal of Calcineurin-like phosphoesterase/N terminal of Calcineurin-like phosphoesterase/Calcineurin-like phosphoesterase
MRHMMVTCGLVLCSLIPVGSSVAAVAEAEPASGTEAAIRLSPASAEGPASPGAVAKGMPFEGMVFDDRDGDGRRGAREPGVPGVAVSDGRHLVRSDAQGRYRLTAEPGRTLFAIKPAGWRFAARGDGLPAFWAHAPATNASAGDAPRPKYGGIVDTASGPRFDIALRREPPRTGGLDVLLFGDPQVKSMADVGYYARDIIDSVLREPVSRQGETKRAHLGLSLGDIADDVLSLYPALNTETKRLGVPWLHVAGNHDIDFDVGRDEDSLQSFRNVYGPDTFAWEEREANIVVLDDVIYRPVQKPEYIGGFREDQFAFLEAYLAAAPKERWLVLAMHIPLFEPEGRDTFRDEDRTRLFALIEGFSKVLILTAHSHTQQHYFHDARTGWRGTAPLHEYNVGAACGAFWSGAKDARGVPDATMADGTPNGYAKLHIEADGRYALAWRVAGPASNDDAAGTVAETSARHAIGLHAPKALRRGAYPAWAVYANVYMGHENTRVEYRIDDSEWKPMQRVQRPDPRLLIENVRDDLAETLRGYDRSPEAEPSKHLWRGALPTNLAAGEHRIDVRAFDTWQGEQNASTIYRLMEASR